MACADFDGQVVRHTTQLKDVLDQFVRVRIVQANAMDLAQFQFDYDLTFAVFLMNADGTIYGRFGSRSDGKEAARDISMEGFRKAMEAALELHRNYPANKTSLAGKKGPAPRFQRPEEYPSLTGKYKATLDYEGKVVQSCMHCHMISEAERKLHRAGSRPLPDEVLFPWPMPDAVGLTLDPQEKATIVKVAAGSQAAKDGFKPGDEIVTLDGQPMLSIADAQWVMHTAKEPAKAKAEVRRGGRKLQLTLTLNKGWRRNSDIAWRPTSWDLRRMAFGGMKMDDMSAEERQGTQLAATQMALLVKHVGQYGDHALAKQAGFVKGDILVAVDGRSNRMTESELFAYILQSQPPGTKLPVSVLRNGQRLNLEMPSQ